MGQFLSDLAEFAKAVGGYWFAIMAWVTFVTGDGADWLGFRKFLDRQIPQQPRRILEIIIMIALIFWCGFQAWQDEKTKYNTAEVRRISSQEWLAKWKARADERWHSIHDPNGYLDQIAQLKNKPPKMVVQRIPGPTVVLPSGTSLSPDQIARAKQIRVQLSALLEEGKHWDVVVRTDGAALQADETQKWADKVESFLRTNLDESYVSRFRDSSDVELRVVNGVDKAHQDLWWGIHVRLIRLNQFIAELSR